MNFRASPHRLSSLLALAAVLALAAAAVRPAAAQVVDTRYWVTDGNINATAQSGDTLYVGGNFTYIGPNTGSGVPLAIATGVPVPGSPRVDGQVLAVVSDGAGGWYLGGLFTKVGGVARQHLAHLLADQSLDPWDPSPDGAVLALATSGSTVFVGGTFTTIGGQARTRIAALDAQTGLATAWAPEANGPVQALALDGGTLYAGGQFTMIGGAPRARIAAMDTTAGIATAWAPEANGLVQALAAGGGVIYVGGGFTSIGGEARTDLAAIDAATGVATAWNADANGFVQALAVSGGTVYAGGSFTLVHAAPRNHLAALDAVTGTPSAWDPNVNNVVQVLAVQGGSVYVGGYFDQVGGQSRRFLAAIDAVSGAPLAWQADANTNIRAMASDGTNLFVGGDLTSVGGVRRGYLAALRVSTGVATSWNPNANNFVNALAIQNGIVYVGGVFTQVGNKPRSSLAAVDAASGATSNWNPSANNTVYALAVSGNKVYVAGGFTQAGGQARNRLAALDVTTSLPSSWNPNANNIVYSIALGGTTLYAGGQFTFVGGQVRSNIAALNLTTGAATPWSPGTDGQVQSLVVTGTTVYAAGGFAIAGGLGRNNLAALDRATGAATSWAPEPDNFVQSIALASGVLYAGGDFTHVGATARNYLAAIDPLTAQPLAWNPNANNFVQSVAVSGSKLFAGGFFSNVGGTGVSGLATLPAATSTLTPPTVALNSPVGGETWAAGSTHDITWSASGVSGIDNVDLQFSTDGGVTWPNVIALSLPNTGVYHWSVPDLSSSQVRVQVVAHDFAGLSGSAASAGNFTIRRWNVVASASPGGSIAPGGTTGVLQGGLQSYSITPSLHQHVSSVLVDGVSVGAVNTYTFSNVSADHTIAASFALDTYTVTASAGADGTISPAGAVAVAYGASQAFTITPAANHHIADVLVDGASVGAVATYTFTNVSVPHTIAASFAVDAAVISAVAPGQTLSPAHPTVTVPVTLASVNTDPLRAFSVTIQLAGGVALAVDTSSIHEGTVLSTGGAPTYFKVIDNGGGRYTVDGSVLGGACGQAPANGTLFTVTLAATATTGSGSVTIGALKLRDCPNAVLASVAGTSASVPIDFVAPAVAVTSPAGGEIWTLGSPHAITWTATDAAGVASIDLLLSTDGGVTYPTSIASALPNSGTYAWTVVPEAAQARVKAVAHDANGNAGEAVSGADFSIRALDLVTSAGSDGSVSPAGTTHPAYGSNVTVTITPNSGFRVADVRVDGASVGAVASYAFTSVTTDHSVAATFTYDISQIVAIAPTALLTPLQPTVEVPVELTGYNPDPVRAFSVSLQLQGGVALANGAASVTEGDFLRTGGAPTVLQVTDHGGGSYTVDGAILGDACGHTPVHGTLFTLTLACSAPGTASHGTVVLQSSKLRDCGNATVPFATGPAVSVPFDYQAPAVTLTSPVGGEDWVLGSPHAITWTATDAAGVASVDLLLSLDNGLTYPTTIVTGLANSGSYTWAASPVTTRARVKVVAHDTNGNPGFATSGTNFIIHTLTLVTSAAAGGTVAPSGTTHPSYGTDVTVSMTPNAGFRVRDVLVDGVSVGAPLSVLFPSFATDHTLAASFADTTSPLVQVTSPNGGEIVTTGDNRNITWIATDNAAVTRIDVLLSRSGLAGPYDTLATGLPNTGTYAWVVSGPPTSAARVKILAHDADGNLGTDASDADFAIHAVAGVDDGPVTAFALAPIAPNPVRASAHLRFDLPREANVHLALVDVQGREVLVLADGTYATGRHVAMLTTAGAGLQPGLYFARLATAGRTFTQRVLVMR